MLHIPLRTPWLDRLVHVEAVCPKNGNLNGEDIRETHDQRNQRDLGRSGLEDFEAFVAACRMTRSRPLPRLHLRETRQRAEQLPDIQIIVASGPQNITRHGTPAFHANTGLASYTIYQSFTIIYRLVVPWWVSGKQNLDQQEEVSRTGLRIIWWSEPEAAVAKPKARVLRSVAHPWRQWECPLKDVNIQQMHLHFVNCLLIYCILLPCLFIRRYLNILKIL